MDRFAVNTTRLFITMATLGIAAMVIWAFAPSWSQNHLMATDALLNLVLTSIFGTYLTRALVHPEAKTNMLRIFDWSINLRTLSIVTAMLFFGVLLFGVNSPVKWISFTHYIVTGLGTLFAYLEMYNYAKSKLQKGISIVSIIVGGGLFVWSLLDNVITVAQGEAFAAAPLIVHVWATSKIE